MADKYTDLPGIDNESAEIFETSDVESDVELAISEPTAENSDIEEPQLDSNQARKKFNNDIIVGDPGVIDFLGTISTPSLRETGYRVSRVDETVEQRLSRIARELEEIKLVQLTKDSSKDEMDDCNNLVNTLEGLVRDSQASDSANLNQYSQRVQQAFAQATEKIHAPTSASEPTEKHPLVDTSLVLAMESRINNIESVVGTETTSSTRASDSKPTLQNYINDLARKINVVHNPEYQLQTVRNEVALLNKEIETLNANKKFLDISHPPAAVPGPEPHQNSKIDDLHKRIPDFDRINVSLPLILTRLKSLHSVHADLAYSIDTVKSLDQVLSDMKSDMAKWNNSIDNVNTKLEDHERQFGLNKDHVIQAIDELTAKANSLNQ